jgi:hypothetical protein
MKNPLSAHLLSCFLERCGFLFILTVLCYCRLILDDDRWSHFDGAHFQDSLEAAGRSSDVIRRRFRIWTISLLGGDTYE